MRDGEYLTPDGVAKLLLCGKTTILRAIRDGKLKVASRHRNGQGVATSLGITREEARRWAREDRRDVGRPRDN